MADEKEILVGVHVLFKAGSDAFYSMTREERDRLVEAFATYVRDPSPENRAGIFNGFHQEVYERKLALDFSEVRYIG